MWPFIQKLGVVPLFVLLGFSSCKIVFFADGSRVRAVQVTPANTTIAVGTGQQFIASVLFSDGINFQVRLTGVLWSSSNPAIATISSDGLATGHSAGTVIITATFDGVSGSTNLTVDAPGPPKVQVAGTASKLEVVFPQTGRKFLYVANPFENTISVYWEDLERRREQLVASFTVEPATGPAWLAVHPSGRFLYVADHGSAEISAFSIDPATGRLKALPGSPFAAQGRLWSIAVDSEGEFVLVSDFDSQALSRFRIEPATGALAPESWP